MPAVAAGQLSGLRARAAHRCRTQGGGRPADPPAQPGQLKSLDLGLFEAWRRLKRIDGQVARPQGPSWLTLAPPARSIKLAR